MGKSDGKLLFGMETEFGYSAVGDDGQQIESSLAIHSFFRVCSNKYMYLPGRSDFHMYLPNGSMVYPDCGHPELASAESSSPISFLQSLRAGERMLASTAEELESRPGISQVNLYKTNVDYSLMGTTWGCHESYLSRNSPGQIAPDVIDHLVTRISFTGAGGFTNQSYGAAFALSPRAAHLDKKTGNESTGKRAIFDLRDESLSDGPYHRVHLICGESNCSELSNYLKVGTTALVIAMADAGIKRKRAMSLTLPVNSILKFSLDEQCKTQARCDDGIRRSAIDIQRQYLELAENNLSQSFMPEWAEEVCTRWRRVLDDLESGPGTALVGSLDWPTKLALFKEHVRCRSDLSWSSLPIWTGVASKILSALSSTTGDRPRISGDQVKKLLATKGPIARRLNYLTSMLVEAGQSWTDLEKFYELRDQLCELDLRYGQLYPRGIYLDLECNNAITDRILVPAQIDAAIDRAPGEGRARVRGDWVRRLAKGNEKYHCSWTGIGGQGERIDLGDPFVTSAEMQVVDEKRKQVDPGSEDVLDIPVFLRPSQRQLFE